MINGEKSGDPRRVFVIEVQENGEAKAIGTVSYRNFDRIARQAEIGMAISDGA